MYITLAFYSKGFTIPQPPVLPSQVQSFQPVHLSDGSTSSLPVASPSQAIPPTPFSDAFFEFSGFLAMLKALGSPQEFDAVLSNIDYLSDAAPFLPADAPALTAILVVAQAPLPHCPPPPPPEFWFSVDGCWGFQVRYVQGAHARLCPHKTKRDKVLAAKQVGLYTSLNSPTPCSERQLKRGQWIITIAWAGPWTYEVLSITPQRLYVHRMQLTSCLTPRYPINAGTT